MSMNVICDRCGKQFERPNWHAMREQRHYCSAECRFPPAIVACTWCGKEKHIPPSAVKEYNFCNRRCLAAWRKGTNFSTRPNTQVTVTCETCGKSFLRQPNAIKRSKHQYCSKKCFYEAHRQTMSGDNNPAWRGGLEPYYGPNWERQARRTRQRDNHTCQHCGITEAELGKLLHAHHIVPLREFHRDFRRANALSNLVSLCSHCHKLLEWHPDQMSQFLASWIPTT
jgi:5-methylcytosine-specific restriction endonuclease McrA